LSDPGFLLQGILAGQKLEDDQSLLLSPLLGQGQPFFQIGGSDLITLGVIENQLIEGIDGFGEFSLAELAFANPVKSVVSQGAVRKAVTVDLEAVHGQVEVALEIIGVGGIIDFLGG
jgi:hypothetical protein